MFKHESTALTETGSLQIIYDLHNHFVKCSLEFTFIKQLHDNNC